jgi:two-component system OmpR family sensor kinase/two-component system sensor histidine kinase QseC
VNSIRTRLLVSLSALLALATLVMGLVAYQRVLAQTEALFDYQLRQMALSLRDQGEIAPAQAGAFSDGQLDFVVQVWSADGRSIYASRPQSALPSRAQIGFADIAVAGRTWRTYSVVSVGRVIQVAQPVQIRRRLAAQSAWASVLPMLLVAPPLLLMAWWLVARSLRPLSRVAGEVRRRDEASLAPLSAETLPDEVAPLVAALNSLLARLGAALDTQRAFVADAAHELRSPLTALKLQLQLLQRAPDDATRERAITVLAAGIERASRLVGQLLALARHEPGAPEAAAFEPVELRALVHETLADVRALVTQRGSTLTLQAGPTVSVDGDAAALALLVRNLADNAVRYSPPGSLVTFGVLQESGRAVLQVDDAGPGIPAADRERVFDRFYRRDPGADTGSGLGLAIVRSIAGRHGASVTLEDSPLGGLRVTVRFGVA